MPWRLGKPLVPEMQAETDRALAADGTCVRPGPPGSAAEDDLGGAPGPSQATAAGRRRARRASAAPITSRLMPHRVSPVTSAPVFGRVALEPVPLM